MFSSLANLLFGSTTANTDPDHNDKDIESPLTEGPTNTNRDPINNDDEWILIDTEGDEEESLPRTDSEEEIPFVEIKRNLALQVRHGGNSGRSRRNRNQRQQARLAHNSTSNSPSAAVLSLSPNRDGITRSLYVVSPLPDGSANIFNQPTSMSMEESWFLTPPPCFTSTGPINMELSPFENLLIEHPSMSVYHSIRSAQEAAESFVNLDLGVEESVVVERKPNRKPVRINAVRYPVRPATTIIQHRSGNRIESVKSAQVKEEVLFRNGQKVHDKKTRENLCRGAIKRNNKVRDFNSKGNRQRRADLQHCRTVSGANNNRKC